jgi:uncharacterized membrane protein
MADRSAGDFRLPPPARHRGPRKNRVGLATLSCCTITAESGSATFKTVEGKMAFCPQCGFKIREGVAYCGNCGAPLEEPGTASGQQVAPVSIQPGISINGASALCYLFGFITGIIFLVLPPYSEDKRVRFHAFQSIFLNVAVCAVHIGVTFVTLMFHAISFSLGLMMSSLHLIVSLIFVLIWLFMMWKSYQGERVVLPIIGPFAERQAGGA